MSNQLNTIYDRLKDEISKIDTTNLPTNTDQQVISTIIEKQKVYFWIRLYLKDEMKDINVGDDFEMSYSPSGESLLVKFVAFGKSNLNKNIDNVIINYDPENDNKVLCLMVDEDDLINLNNIPFIRTLFRTSRFFEFQVYRRDELIFKNIRTNEVSDYIDVSF